MIICAIDPGLSGAFVSLKDGDLNGCDVMPLNSSKEIDFNAVMEILRLHTPDHVFLERAVPFAMGTKSAFNYGRGFAVLEIAVMLSGVPVTYVEPGKWTKVMHEGIAADLKPKAKSIIAFERLFARFAQQVPRSKTGKIHEGILDALLIAAYGVRKLSSST